MLRRAYEELHPGLYRYNSKTAMDAKFGELQREFAHDLSLQEAYVDLSVFAAEVKCGHTYPNVLQPEEDDCRRFLKGTTVFRSTSGGSIERWW